MKNIRNIFGFVFTALFPISILCLIGGAILMFDLFITGYMRGEYEIIKYVFLITMITAPVGMTFVFSKPLFQNIKLEQVEIRPEYPALMKWLAPKINAFASLAYETKTLFARIYGKYYTLPFRVLYGIFSWYMLAKTTRLLPLVYTIDERTIVMIASNLSFGITTLLVILHWFASHNQSKTQTN